MSLLFCHGRTRETPPLVSASLLRARCSKSEISLGDLAFELRQPRRDARQLAKNIGMTLFVQRKEKAPLSSGILSQALNSDC